MTTHKIYAGDSSDMPSVEDGSVNLIVTSPPYPMVSMWDDMFAMQDPEISKALETEDGGTAFRKMHSLLNRVWRECDRVLAGGGFACINIGDAARTTGRRFQLYSNHAQVINSFMSMNYCNLPDIHWRKQSNAPNKFMGSGMYPAGAYVTYEHEYILVFRKGDKRIFSEKEKELRRKSAYFWEERNVWFSDLWDIKGASQSLKGTNAGRSRNASFPFEIPYRLVNMYSIEGDTVLDPFAGLGTTCLASMAANRNSIGYDIDKEITHSAIEHIRQGIPSLNTVIDSRLESHLAFMAELSEETVSRCYRNIPHGFYVKTRQETSIEIDRIKDAVQTDEGFQVLYSCLEKR